MMISHPGSCATDENLIDRDVNQFDEVSDDSHDGETSSDCPADLNVLCQKGDSAISVGTCKAWSLETTRSLGRRVEYDNYAAYAHPSYQAWCIGS